MISSYRLGDLVLLNIDGNDILREHPNSIASKYILEKRNNNGCNNIDLITNWKEVVDVSFKDSEGDVQKGKKLIGDCKEILLAPQGIGLIRKNIQDLNL